MEPNIPIDPDDPDFLTPQPAPKPTFKEHFVDFFQTLVVFLAIGTVIYLFVAQPHKVSGKSMFPNFHDGDYIITDKVTYKFSSPVRGDIVVFKNPNNPDEDFIKRVIGLPGERIKVQGGRVYINGNLLDEKYLKGITTGDGAFLTDGREITISQGKYIVIGDNRPGSSDSRAWGELPFEKILGKVIIRYWPQAVFGLYPEEYRFPEDITKS